MRKKQTYLSFVLGLLIAFPIVFQSFHAIEHHVLANDIEEHSCDSHHEAKNTNNQSDLATIDSEFELCPICEYQIVYFFNEKKELAEQKFAFVKDFKTPILEQPIVEYRDCKNKLRGPPVI